MGSDSQHTDNSILKNPAALSLLGFIALVLVASVIVIFMNSGRKSQGSKAYIYQNNILIETIDLSDIRETQRIEIIAENGTDSNVIEVRPGGLVGVVEATCPDGLCKNMGFVDNDLWPITCLPNHLVIQVVSDSKEKELDGVAR